MDPFAAPDEATGARRAARAAARAYTRSALADHCVGEALEVVLAGREQPPTQITLPHVQWLYQDAARSLTSASRHLRQHIQPPRTGRTRRPAAEPGRTERQGAARPRTALRLPFRKTTAMDLPPAPPGATPPTTRR
ncbi:hypothetical protein [Kitasatospora sp. NPDC057015]|uniref:hypothetical protein n=1 Tax=Kitasatospora sp. NPDC057015 TaxID=3346001 RepID=UPI003643710F